VFSYLNIGSLLRCGQVSKRIRQIWNDESLWQSVDLSFFGYSSDSYNNKGGNCKVQTDFIIFLLDKGCKYLNLWGAELTGTLELDKPSKLKRLNLEECVANREVFEEILYSCHSLQQLSVQQIFSDQDFEYHNVRRIILQNSKTLQKINLGAFEWLNDTSKPNFFRHCQELTDVRITGDCGIRSDQLDLIIESFPLGILKIDLAWNNDLTDFHIENLVRKCNKITEISLHDTSVTNQSVISIVKYLKNSLELLDLTNCDNINLEDIVEAVGSLPKLKYLHYEVHTVDGFPCNHSYTPTEKMCQPCDRLKRKCPGRIEKMCVPCERVKKVCPGAFIQGDPMFVIAMVDNYDFKD
jgi:hypothetical protein